MLDTTPVTAAIAAMIRTGTTEQALLAAVAHLFSGSVPGRTVSSPAGGYRSGREARGKEALMPTSPPRPSPPRRPVARASVSDTRTTP